MTPVYEAPATAAPVLLALVLAVSGGMKLRERDTVEDAFFSLRLPAVLTRLGAPTILPYGEIALAVALVLTHGGAALVVAAVTLALFVAYLVVIVRALGFEGPVTCACFGKLGLGTVDAFTAVRNVLLVILSIVTLLDAMRGRSVIARVANFDATDRAWLIAVLVAVLLTWLIAGGRVGAPRDGRAELATSGPREHRALPSVSLDSPNGTSVDVRDIAPHEQVLLLLVSPTCGSCQAVIERVRSRRGERSPVRAILVLAGPARTPSGLSDEADLDVLFDPRDELVRLFGVATPAALAIGADGRLDGPPVSGKQDVLALLDEVDGHAGGGAGGGSPVEPRVESSPDSSGEPAEVEDVDAADYLRRPTPYALFTDGHGSQFSLLELGRRGPAVLLLVSPSCGSCLEVLERAPAWQAQLRGVPVHFVVDYPQALDSLRGRGIPDENILFDESASVARMMGVGTPSLFAVGPDDQLLAGPVSGLQDVTETMEAIIAEVASARPEQP